MRLLIYSSILLAATWLVLTIFSVSIGENINDTGFKFQTNVQLLFPEGWGFFTRDPREDQYLMFQQLGEDDVRVVTFKNASSRNFFGFSRKGRRVHMEFQRVQTFVPDSMWNHAVTDINSVIAKAPDVELDNIGDYDYFHIDKGTYIIERSKPIPWSYSMHKSLYEQDNKYLKIKIN